MSFACILSDFEMREAIAKGYIKYNITSKMQQINDKSQGARRKAQCEINSGNILDRLIEGCTLQLRGVLLEKRPCVQNHLRTIDQRLGSCCV